VAAAPASAGSLTGLPRQRVTARPLAAAS
jgi:hypothetical protein